MRSALRFDRRREQVKVPERGDLMQLELFSGGAEQTIGIMAIISLMGIGEGMQAAITEELSSLSDTMFVTTGTIDANAMGRDFDPSDLYFTERDLSVIQRTPGVAKVSPVAFYGATGGEAYINGVAGERFCVRNSGVHAVVEGVGDHGCEYMTGGRVVVLGKVGRNFAAGMSGGVAYVYDQDGTFEKFVNKEMVLLENLNKNIEADMVRSMIKKHYQFTDSDLAERLLDNWNDTLDKFVKVIPVDYKNIITEIEKAVESGKDLETAQLAAFRKYAG